MNFNLNNINKKIVLYFSLLGFVLSLISGLVSGNRFGTLLIRSLISGIAVGIVIAIANVVIALYLPELLEENSNDDSEDEDDDSRVNIVMPEEKYTVQSDSSVSTTDNNDVQSQGGPDKGSFKEVGLDNLQSLSAASNDNFVNNDESYNNSEDDYSQSSSTSGPASDLSNHDPEEIAKAVKTVLKRD